MQYTLINITTDLGREDGMVVGELSVESLLSCKNNISTHEKNGLIEQK